MSGDEPGVTGLTQRDLLMEMREDIKGRKTSVDAIAKDQALGVGMTGRGNAAGEVRKTGLGERSQPSGTGLFVPPWRLPMRVA